MQQPSSSAHQSIHRGGNFGKHFREGYDQRVLELVIHAYKSMCEDGCYPAKEEEERFSAILADYIEKYCPIYSKLTRQQWDVVREHYHDNEQVRKGQASPRKVPRIDIVVVRWRALGKPKEIFPFECKLLDENDSNSIRLYIKEGLIERYLTEKDYSRGSSWGGMIGYLLQGKHETIVMKLNEQIERQLQRSTDYLQIHQPIDEFYAIYRSQHQRPEQQTPLIITHLFLTVSIFIL